MQLAAFTSLGDLGEVLALPLGPFPSWDCGEACWRVFTQVLLWHTWRGEGGPLSLVSLKTGPVETHLGHHLLFMRNVLSALEQAIQMHQRPLLPGEYSHLTAFCLGFPRC